MHAAHLDDRAVVRIAGPDAKTLLQNVVTLDVDRVDSHGSGYGALLTPQGKILWDFLLHRSDDGYAADLRADQAEGFAKRLKLYRLRAKVEIAAAPELNVMVQWDDPLGASAQGGETARRSPARRAREHAGLRRRPTDRPMHLRPTGIATASRSPSPKAASTSSSATRFRTTPGMDSLGGIAFEKGCYIGQEVVSRMRHRGTARRRVVAVCR